MRLVTLLFLSMIGMAVAAEEAPKSDLFAAPDAHDLDKYVWTKRPLVVFADSENDPVFQRQIEMLRAREAELLERDVIVLIDSDPSVKTALRRKLRPRGFAIVLIGKDGGVKLRKPFPWNVRELSRVIDKMPMRRQEIRDRQ